MTDHYHQQYNHHQSNPLIDADFLDTLANIQAMLARIQTFAINAKEKPTISSRTKSPDTEFYSRLLIMVNEAISYEIQRLSHQKRER